MQVAYRKRWSPGWKMTAFVAVFLPLLASLGVWQISRADEKRVREELVFERLGMLPVVVPESIEGMQYRHVRLVGAFESNRYFLLDNQMVQGTPGYWIIASFLSTDGRRWLVNRGWIPAPRLREDLPEVAFIEGQLTLTGIIWPQLGMVPLLAEDVWPQTWPKRVQRMNIARMAATLDNTTAVEIRLEDGQPGVLKPVKLYTGVGVDRHLGYAAQWFGLAVVLMIGYVFVGLKPSG
ncbi:MAG: SURF1 family protein [Gammaproteobacteria bacterium]|nr:SURF1 family protein [Gammaproteobacteria bacterium]